VATNDEDPTHDLRGDTKEMSPVTPIAVALIDESQIGLVDECRRLQGVAHPLMPKLPLRDPAQLGVNERQQLIECAAIPATPVPRAAP
jgi:hypothetical protein